MADRLTKPCLNCETVDYCPTACDRCPSWASYMKERDEMNPDTNRFESLKTPRGGDIITEQVKEALTNLLRPDGSPVPKTWTTFQVGEHVVIKNYTFKVAYIGETAVLFEPVGPVIVGEKKL